MRKLANYAAIAVLDSDEEKNTVKYEASYLKKMLEENIEKIFPQKN